MPPNKNVILVDTNLFFSAKISADLKRMGYSVIIEKSFEGVKDNAGPETGAVVLNLNAPGIDVMEIIKNLKAAPETARIQLIGFGGHKEQGLLQTARALGCDRVVANSAMTAELSAFLSPSNEGGKGGGQA